MDQFTRNQFSDHTSYDVTSTMGASRMLAATLSETVEYLREHPEEEVYVVVHNSSSASSEITKYVRQQLMQSFGGSNLESVS